MASLNSVQILGNLTRDVELKRTPSGAAVASLSVAVNESYFDKATNSKKETVTYVDVTCWNRTAEVAAEFLGKGSQVLICGRLKTESWNDRESGQKRSKLSVTCDNLQMLGSRQQGGGERQQQRDEPKPHQEAPNSFDEPVYNPGQVDDVPF